MLLLLPRAVMVTLSLLLMVPLAWMLRRESVWFKPMLVPARGLKVLVSSNATSKASLAVLVVSPVTRLLSLMVNWRVFAPVGMMKAWVSSESFWESSVRVAEPLMMLVAPRVFQPVAEVKSPLLIASNAPAVRGALIAPPIPDSRLVLSGVEVLPIPALIALRMDRSSTDGSLRTPGLRLVFMRSWG
jgi:hypothetical protein